MLVQVRNDNSIWCVSQHDHARLSGFLAHHWVGLEEEAKPLSWELVQAVTLHDMPWVKEDLTPRYNPKTKLPFSFIDFPWTDRVPLYDRGLQEMALLDPEVALLVSLHYASFKGTLSMEEFQRQETNRREALREQLGLLTDDEDESLQRSLSFLQLFDILSLGLCLKSPQTQEAHWPRWLMPDNRVKTPDGATLQMLWQEENCVAWDPYPWEKDLQFSIPYRCLEGSQFASEEELISLWNQAPVQFFSLDIRAL